MNFNNEEYIFVTLSGLVHTDVLAASIHVAASHC